MSESVANALVNSGNKDAEEIAKFIRMIDKFFDSLNVVNLVIGKKRGRHSNHPTCPVMIFVCRYVSCGC